jgi:hypothetical protein
MGRLGITHLAAVSGTGYIPRPLAAAAVSLLASFCSASRSALSLRCVQELLKRLLLRLWLPPRPPETPLHHLTRGRSLPPPGFWLLLDPCAPSSGSERALRPAPQRRSESQGAEIPFKTLVSAEL